jgi:hypothetical protein
VSDTENDSAVKRAPGMVAAAYKRLMEECGFDEPAKSVLRWDEGDLFLIAPGDEGVHVVVVIDGEKKAAHLWLRESILPGIVEAAREALPAEMFSEAAGLPVVTP